MRKILLISVFSLALAACGGGGGGGDSSGSSGGSGGSGSSGSSEFCASGGGGSYPRHFTPRNCFCCAYGFRIIVI